MMRRYLPAAMVILALLAAPLTAQIALPSLQVPDPGGVLGGVTDAARDNLRNVEANARREAAALLRARERNLGRLLRRNRDSMERDARGELARRGELLATGLDMVQVPALQQAGFAVLSYERIEALDLSIVRLSVPDGLRLADAEALARQIAPTAQISADNLHFQSGAAAGDMATLMSMMAQSAAAISIDIGVIDGAPGPAVQVLRTRGFAKGAPVASNHGSAVASLLKSTGAARIRVADVYGTDPAGGNALAIARGLGYLVASGSRVITISLVGPRNTVLEKAIGATQRKGVVVVAAVGNDGPAAPPAYPASYPGVVAVTGVDKRGRALIEAGRALHLDYAAPGADIYGLDAQGKRTRLRGTSFATPLVATRLAAALQSGGSWRRRLDAEARDLGAKGVDPVFGRGLLCGGCAQKK